MRKGFLRASLLAVALAAAAAPGVAQEQKQEPQDAPPIRNFLRVNKDFCTGGQPRPEHLKTLRDEGVRAVINLRPRGEHRADEEEAAAKDAGLKYFNIPVVFRDPKDEQVAEFLKLTDDPANRPAFVHCAGAVRVGAFWMIRRVLRDGWTVDDARAEAEKIGLRESPHLVEFALSYIERHRKK
ncbi:MAG TPA: protein tyrosine phosphatase family protein [Pyrinomonadaceae bacterium]|nr:protein tyrosine phosphatase family protein [Pyrinomonadaceae bacterium]